MPARHKTQKKNFRSALNLLPGNQVDNTSKWISIVVAVVVIIIIIIIGCYCYCYCRRLSHWHEWL